MSAILYYFHDPMCSWCYAFQPVWQVIKSKLPENIEVKYMLGGLAADDDNPMEASLQQTIQQYWQRIEQVVPGTVFNFDFWTECEARRSTYPACRAVIAAKNQGLEYEEAMILAIQNAYYRQALNPSDYPTHIKLAEKMGLELKMFSQDLRSAETESELIRQIQVSQSMNVRGFPSLVLSLKQQAHAIPIDYNNAEPSLNKIRDLL